jgi:hypothetical protein
MGCQARGVESSWPHDQVYWQRWARSGTPTSQADTSTASARRAKAAVIVHLPP